MSCYRYSSQNIKTGPGRKWQENINCNFMGHSIPLCHLYFTCFATHCNTHLWDINSLDKVSHWKKIRPAEATTHVNYCISLLKISKAGHAFLHNYLQVYRQKRGEIKRGAFFFKKCEWKPLSWKAGGNLMQQNWGWNKENLLRSSMNFQLTQKLVWQHYSYFHRLLVPVVPWNNSQPAQKDFLLSLLL